MDTFLTILITVLISVAVAISATLFVINVILKKRREKILKEAETEGENIKKEKILQAKEKFLQLKSEHEKFINEKNIERGSARKFKFKDYYAK